CAVVTSTARREALFPLDQLSDRHRGKRRGNESPGHDRTAHELPPARGEYFVVDANYRGLQQHGNAWVLRDHWQQASKDDKLIKLGQQLKTITSREALSMKLS